MAAVSLRACAADVDDEEGEWLLSGALPRDSEDHCGPGAVRGGGGWMMNLATSWWVPWYLGERHW